VDDSYLKGLIKKAETLRKEARQAVEKYQNARDRLDEERKKRSRSDKHFFLPKKGKRSRKTAQ
jgi:hypothetical protein